MKSFNKIALSILLSSSVISSINAAQTCTSGTGSTGGDCDVSINENTYNTGEHTDTVVNLIEDTLGFGTTSFSSLEQKDGNEVANSSIYDYMAPISYNAVTMFIQNLVLPTYRIGEWLPFEFLPAVYSSTSNSEASTFSNKVNSTYEVAQQNIANTYFELNLDNIYTNPSAGTGNTNRSTWNNGTVPIYQIDKTPYTFPHATQLIQNSLSSVTTLSFLNFVNACQWSDTDQNTQSGSCMMPTGITLDSATNQKIMPLQPIEQLNSAAGLGFISTEDNTGNGATPTNGLFGTIVPTYNDFMKGTYARDVIPSLSASSLLNPLSYNRRYNYVNNEANTVMTPIRDPQLGLYGLTQLSAADDYVRYLSSELMPTTLSTEGEYDEYKAVANKTGGCYQSRADASMKVKAYRLLMRNYAAQASVGTDNLYYILNKRRPGNSSDTQSQLEQEYKMATYRLFNSTTTDTGQTTNWQQQLLTANQATIQIEQTKLLAEINYQLFLNRKEQERILFTLSAMHLSNTSQLKKQLTISEAATYISNKPLTEDNCGNQGNVLTNPQT